jgi:hypothetical protein
VPARTRISAKVSKSDGERSRFSRGGLSYARASNSRSQATRTSAGTVTKADLGLHPSIENRCEGHRLVCQHGSAGRAEGHLTERRPVSSPLTKSGSGGTIRLMPPRSGHQARFAPDSDAFAIEPAYHSQPCSCLGSAIWLPLTSILAGPRWGGPVGSPRNAADNTDMPNSSRSDGGVCTSRHVPPEPRLQQMAGEVAGGLCQPVVSRTSSVRSICRKPLLLRANTHTTAFVASGRDLITFSLVCGNTADVRHEDAGLFRNIGPDVP